MSAGDRFPVGRPGFLGPDQPWPCRCCGQSVAEELHACRRWHRGDRVLVLPNQQMAVVDGWKGRRLLLLFGKISSVGAVRAWYPDAEVVFQYGGEPVIV